MRLEIHFYGKTQVSVLIQAEASDATPDDELLLFAWFTLRQFHNLGHNPAADAFAGLVRQSDIVSEVVKDNPCFPSAAELIKSATLAKYAGNFGSKEAMRAVVDLAIRGQSGDHIFDLINRDFLSAIPRIIDYPRKPGEKRFVAVLPPGTLDMKGFGILGVQVNYYTCHSIIALLGFLARKNSTDHTYLNRLAFIAYSCGSTHMQNEISMTNQRELATQFAMTAK
jgi:hypothetical protein